MVNAPLKSQMHVGLHFDESVENAKVFHRKLVESMMALRNGLDSGSVMTTEKKRITFTAAVEVITHALRGDGVISRMDEFGVEKLKDLMDSVTRWADGTCMVDDDDDAMGFAEDMADDYNYVYGYVDSMVKCYNDNYFN